MDEIVMEQPYKVLIRVDADGRVVAITRRAFITDMGGWVEIDSGFSDRHHHAQGNYLPLPLMDERGVYRYKLVDGKVAERTRDEMDADYVEPEPKPSTEERVAQLEAQNETLLECLLEMSEIVYA